MYNASTLTTSGIQTTITKIISATTTNLSSNATSTPSQNITTTDSLPTSTASLPTTTHCKAISGVEFWVTFCYIFTLVWALMVAISIAIYATSKVRKYKRQKQLAYEEQLLEALETDSYDEQQKSTTARLSMVRSPVASQQKSKSARSFRQPWGATRGPSEVNLVMMCHSQHSPSLQSRNDSVSTKTLSKEEKQPQGRKGMMAPNQKK